MNYDKQTQQAQDYIVSDVVVKCENRKKNGIHAFTFTFRSMVIEYKNIYFIKP